MMFPGNGCCCDTPPPCRMMQVNALKAQGGYPGNESPWIGSWVSVAGSDIGTLQYVEANTLYLASVFSWPLWQSRTGCSTTRFLKYVEDGFSNHPIDLPPNTVVPIYWHGEIIWDRETGHVLTALFTINYNGGGDEIYFSATLNQSTGVYTIVDNSATAHVPTWQTVDATGFSGGRATINLNENGASYEYIIPDSGHGLGETTQSLTITLSDRYDEADVFEDAVALLDLIDLSNIDTGDSTGTFVPLEWNTDYNITYANWPNEVVVTDFDVCGGLHFSPYISRLYGPYADVTDAIYGDTATFSGYHFPGRTMHMSAPPETSGTWTGYPGPSLVALRWIYVSKLRVSPEGESACLASREQQFCDCTPLDIVYGPDCVTNAYEMTDVTDCDNAFASGDSQIYLRPEDLIFNYGVGILYPACRTGNCSGLNIAPSCCN